MRTQPGLAFELGSLSSREPRESGLSTIRDVEPSNGVVVRGAGVLAIVIPTCNRPAELKRCLVALQVGIEKLRAIGTVVEVIVSDDGSESAEGIVGQFDWAGWSEGPHRGASANRNAGAQAVNGNWIAFLDDDVIPEPGLPAAYLGAIISRGQRSEVFEGRVVADRARQAFNEAAPINLTGGALWSCNFAISRAVFERVGGFDERFPCPGMEDTDLKFRLSSLGVQVEFIAEATVCHPWRRTSLREAGARFRNLELFLDFHPSEIEKYSWQYYGRGVVHCVNDLRRNVLCYHARGAGYQIGYTALSAVLSARLLLRTRRLKRY